MNFTISTVAKSLADYLAPVLPGVTFCEDPNQQGSDPPMLFLQNRYSRLERETGGHWLRKIGLDLTYLEDYNLPDLQQRYQNAAEALDLVMETFPYRDGDGGPRVLLRTYGREWAIDPDAMHYQFELRERVSIPQEYARMQTMEYHGEVSDGPASKAVCPESPAAGPAVCPVPAGRPAGHPAQRN